MQPPDAARCGRAQEANRCHHLRRRNQHAPGKAVGSSLPTTRTNSAILYSLCGALFVWLDSLPTFILWRRSWPRICFIHMSAKSAHEVPEAFENPDPVVPRRRGAGFHHRRNTLFGRIRQSDDRHHADAQETPSALIPGVSVVAII